ncbi:auxilin-related protein 1-like [Bidens hawaiensis]|uniref:auxilin-related protein 1-like n=1 Tax=Bidens hawaiensis TaxID=980011 RepID=UPI0040497627
MKSSSGSGDHFDVLGNRVSPVVKTKPVDDLIGSFGGMGINTGGGGGGKQASGSNYNANVMKSSGLKKSPVKNQEAASEPADLLSGFGVKSSSLNGRKSEANTGVRSAKSFSGSADDLFGMFETTQVNDGASDYLDSLFSSSTQSNTGSNQSFTTEDSVYDSLFNSNVVPKKQNKASLNNTKQASSKPNTTTDDFSYLFGMGVAPTSGEFQEIEGESEERRRARYNHHMATRKRMNNALDEKNKRDLQAQQEQDEKHRVAATLDGDIKRWAVGKEGNLRALISSLQHVLWVGSGWQPISLTDLITSTAVKKAYYKATLCVHPDKVQQKGASVQQKYIAEKVFDLLKEAWNKFNAEEFKKQ